jgi:hypothetical protein
MRMQDKRWNTWQSIPLSAFDSSLKSKNLRCAKTACIFCTTEAFLCSPITDLLFLRRKLVPELEAEDQRTEKRKLRLLQHSYYDIPRLFSSRCNIKKYISKPLRRLILSVFSA